MAGKVTMQFTAEDARAIGKIKDLNQQIEKQQKKLEKVTKESKQAGKASSWMKDAKRDILSMATGYFTVQGAVQGLTSAMRQLREEQQRAKESRGEAFGAFGRLIQLAGGDKKRFGQLRGQADQLRTQFGMSQEMAGNLVFDLTSGGEGKNADLFGSLYGAVQDPGQIAQAVIKAKRGFGRDETGSSRSLINKMAAAAVQDVATVEDVGQEIARVSAASGKSGIGASDEETLAVLSTLITNFRNAEEGGVRTARLAQFFAKKGVKGGFVAGLTDERFANLQGQDLIEAIPEIRAREGFIQARNNLQEIRSKTGRIDAAGRAAPGEDTVSQMTALVRSEFGDVIAALSAQERLKIIEEQRFGRNANRVVAGAAGERARLAQLEVGDRLAGNLGVLLGENVPGVEALSGTQAEVIPQAAGQAAVATKRALVDNDVFGVLSQIRDILQDRSPSRQPAVGGFQ